MASVNIFETLRARVEKSDGLLPQERRAIRWFQNYNSELQSWQAEHRGGSFNAVATSKFDKRLVSHKAAMMGCLYFFLYAPIHKDKLHIIQYPHQVV